MSEAVAEPAREPAAAVDGRAGRSPRRRWRLAAALLVGVTLVVLVRGLLVEPIQVESGSMAPTLRAGQWVLLEKATLRLRPPHRDELVVFRSPADGALTLKRVVGAAGDTVEIRDAVLFVNDRRIDEPYVDLASIDGLYYGPVTVPPRAVLVLGDNRAQSVDSRSFGPVPLTAVRGRAWTF